MEQQAFGKQLAEAIDPLPRKRATFLLIDATAQIAHDAPENDAPSQNIRGPYARSAKTDKGDGVFFKKLRAQKRFAPRNIWHRPPKLGANPPDYSTRTIPTGLILK